MSRKQKRMGPVGCFGQIENIKRQSLIILMTCVSCQIGGRVICTDRYHPFLKAVFLLLERVGSKNEFFSWFVV